MQTQTQAQALRLARSRPNRLRGVSQQVSKPWSKLILLFGSKLALVLVLTFALALVTALAGCTSTVHTAGEAAGEAAGDAAGEAAGDTTEGAPVDPQALSDTDRQAIDQLAEIVVRDAFAGQVVELVEVVEGVECWAPSEHLIAENQFRVMCRMHYQEAEQSRYHDVICVGDILSTPIAERCYEWAPYTDTPAFEDYRALK